MQDKYNGVCSECNHEFMASKSIFQTWGMNDAGHGTCPNCKTFLNLTFDESSNAFKTMPWKNYVEQMKTANNAGKERNDG